MSWFERVCRRLCVVVLVAGSVGCVWAVPGYAAGLSVIPSGDLGFSADVSTTQAGAHPDATTSFNLTLAPTFAEQAEHGAMLKGSVVDLPPGVVGNPEAVQKCTTDQLATSSFTDCPFASQVGVVTVRGRFADGSPDPDNFVIVPLYAVRPSVDQLAVFAFKVQGTTVTLVATVRPSDFGVRLTTRNALQIVPISGVTVTVWGVPADPVHDLQRCRAIGSILFGFDGTCHSPPNTQQDENVPAGTPAVRPEAFFTNPTVCDGPKLTSIRVSSWWVEPAGVLSDPVTDSSPTPTGCERLSFDPSIDIRPDSSKADAPTGLSVDLTVPQSEDPKGLATAHLKDVQVRLPEGLTVSPSSADGLAACSDEQIGIGTDSPVGCPEASKIGTAIAETPVLGKPLTGSVYVGSQRSSDPESGEMFRLFLVVKGPGGLVIKLVGHIHADRRTGQLTTTFANNPQVPVSKISLELKSGPRAPLAMPASCGNKASAANLLSWGGQARALEDVFSVDCPGVQGFGPAFRAGTVNPRAGGFSPFVARIERPDGQEFIDGATVDLPRGLTAKLKGVALCGDAQATAGTCPIQSRVGTVKVGVGPGTHPFFLGGSVSLTGPYQGAPYGLSVAVPAIAGPFDLGTVVVRQALFVNPVDAHIRAVSDPLPTIVGGVPPRIRSIDIDVDRPSFMINPTSCAAKRVTASLHSQQGSVVSVAERFQAGDCQALGFKPRLGLRFTGKGQTSDGDHPGLNARIVEPRGQANIAKAQVALPLSVALDPSNANGLCEFAEGQKPDPKCPKGSIIGEARAVTPLLNHPLAGKVYFVKGIRKDPKSGRLIRTLPTLLVTLRGEIAINLRGTTSVKHGKLVSTFAAAPDAAVSRFDLSLKGGKGGILVVTTNRNLCRARQVAQTRIVAHNAKSINTDTPIATHCHASKSSRNNR
jgi:hypothetical protein